MALPFEVRCRRQVTVPRRRWFESRQFRVRQRSLYEGTVDVQGFTGGRAVK